MWKGGGIHFAFRLAALACAVAAACAVRAGEPEDAPRAAGAAEALYRSAFEPGPSAGMREAILRDVVNRHPDSPWAGDALWALALVADRTGNTARAVMWRRRLLEDFENHSLRWFTTEQHLYRSSGLPGIIYLLEAKGLRYTHDSATVYSYNPLPFTVHYALAAAYQEMGYLGPAGIHFRKARAKAPPLDIFGSLIEGRIRHVDLATESAGD